MQAAIEIYKNDGVSFTEWFMDNYELLLELEKEHIRISYNDGKNSVLNNEIKSSIEYYNLNWNQNNLAIMTNNKVGLSNPDETTNNKLIINQTEDDENLRFY